MVTLICGDASQYRGTADFVFTHPYAPFPKQLRGKPGFINLFTPPREEDVRRVKAEGWIGAELHPLGTWSCRANTLYVTGLPVRPVDIRLLEAVPPGWFPEALVRRVLQEYNDLIPAGSVIWDGFMGRGTVGRVAKDMGYGYVGMDIDPARHRLAMEYVWA